MLEEESTSRLVLPSVPAEFADDAVAAWSEAVEIDSYLPEEPDRFPAYLNSRVYQGSSGRVFPLPFHERISATKRPHAWQAVHLENRWLRIMILPELGGRIHIAYDKIAGYDLFYRNNVIKPALVGLTGPWISGGVEFNWPQHHRPATFLPTDVEIEREADGSITVWCSDHDPFARMKGMHGVRLRPDSSRLELRVRLTNRSEVRQSFLWWANVAVRVNDHYQSFFPSDVDYVADHARRAITSFPASDRPYYDIDYRARVDADHPDADRLDWWRNIPVPTSYMIVRTGHEFFGGYDHGRAAGFVHWAPREVSPGKKQWTWGNAPFGEAWERNLTDGDGPYIELMAGVYTDNQPDFAWLLPGETKSFTQVWYPIREIGPATRATREVAARIEAVDGVVRLGVMASERLDAAVVRIRDEDGRSLEEQTVDLGPDAAWTMTVEGTGAVFEIEHAGRIILAGTTESPAPGPEPEPAAEPPAPADVASVDELWAIGAYLQQYRHATRSPEPYFEEALRRDPADARSAASLGAIAYERGRYVEAEQLLRIAVGRQTAWAPSPRDGEPRYLLGLALARQGRADAAAALLARAAWDGGLADAAETALARILARTDRARAIEVLTATVRRSPEHLQARDLLASLLTAAGDRAAEPLIAATLALDPLDHWARDLAGLPPIADAPTLLDVALEYASIGLDDRALAALDAAAAASAATPLGQVQVAPLVEYHRAAILLRAGQEEAARAAGRAARDADARWANASRLDDVAALETALALNPEDPLAALLLGNWYYDRQRAADAREAWTRVLGSDRTDLSVIAERNLGILAYNVDHDREAAVASYARARSLAPGDAKLLYEADQLAGRLGVDPADRLRELELFGALVDSRDDLTVVRARLLTATGRAREARDLLAARSFQPWEGGEGQVLEAWDDAILTIAREALAAGDPQAALAALDEALQPPRSLGEARHLLVNDAEVQFVLGEARAAAGDGNAAREAWARAASSIGDFARMAATPYSLRTAWSILALRRLGDHDAADRLLAGVAAWVESEATVRASIDYFATSLPSMLLFIDNPQIEHDREVAALRERLRDPALAAPVEAAP